jgi:hypothetical protein
MSPKELYYFLGQCLSLDEIPDPESEILPTLFRTDFSWEHFVHMGSSHLVLPALYVKFRNSHLLPHLPEDLVTHLHRLYELNSERNKQLKTQIEWLVNLLRTAGIKPVFLKGAGVLMDGLYPDPGERILADIDCMVRETEVEKSVSLLKSEGYIPRPYHPASLPMMHHYPALFKPHEPAPIEMHHIPVGRRQLKYIDMNELKSYLFGSEEASPLTLRTEDQVMINVIHALLKNRGQYYANLSLRNVYEFYRLSMQHDPGRIRLQHPRLTLIFNNYMAVASRMFHPAKPYPVRNRLRTRIFMIRFELNKTSGIYNRISWATRSIADLIFTYLYIIGKSLTRKEYRRYLRVRLSDLKWYHHHLSVLRQRFSFHSFKK